MGGAGSRWPIHRHRQRRSYGMAPAATANNGSSPKACPQSAGTSAPSNRVDSNAAHADWRRVAARSPASSGTSGQFGRSLRYAVAALAGLGELGQRFFGRFLARFLNFYLSRVTAANPCPGVRACRGSYSIVIAIDLRLLFRIPFGNPFVHRFDVRLQVVPRSCIRLKDPVADGLFKIHTGALIAWDVEALYHLQHF